MLDRVLECGQWSMLSVGRRSMSSLVVCNVAMVLKSCWCCMDCITPTGVFLGMAIGSSELFLRMRL